MGESEYKTIIDKALEDATHLILVTSSASNAESKWVRYEWDSFDGELLAERKSGNIVVVLCGGLDEGTLPYALRRRQAVSFPSEIALLPSFLGATQSHARERRRAIPFRVSVGALLMAIGIIYFVYHWITHKKIGYADHEGQPPSPSIPGDPKKPVILKLHRDWEFTNNQSYVDIYVNDVKLGSIAPATDRTFTFTPKPDGRNVLRTDKPGETDYSYERVLVAAPGEVVVAEAEFWTRASIKVRILSVSTPSENESKNATFPK